MSELDEIIRAASSMVEQSPQEKCETLLKMFDVKVSELRNSVSAFEPNSEEWRYRVDNLNRVAEQIHHFRRNLNNDPSLANDTNLQVWVGSLKNFLVEYHQTTDLANLGFVPIAGGEYVHQTALQQSGAGASDQPDRPQAETRDVESTEQQAEPARAGRMTQAERNEAYAYNVANIRVAELLDEVETLKSDYVAKLGEFGEVGIAEGALASIHATLLGYEQERRLTDPAENPFHQREVLTGLKNLYKKGVAELEVQIKTRAEQRKETAEKDGARRLKIAGRILGRELKPDDPGVEKLLAENAELIDREIEKEDAKIGIEFLSTMRDQEITEDELLVKFQELVKRIEEETGEAPNLDSQSIRTIIMKTAIEEILAERGAKLEQDKAGLVKKESPKPGPTEWEIAEEKERAKRAEQYVVIMAFGNKERKTINEFYSELTHAFRKGKKDARLTETSRALDYLANLDAEYKAKGYKGVLVSEEFVKKYIPKSARHLFDGYIHKDFQHPKWVNIGDVKRWEALKAEEVEPELTVDVEDLPTEHENTEGETYEELGSEGFDDEISIDKTV